MKRIMIVFAGALLVLAFPMMLNAGDYHSGSTLVCTQCHVMHYSMSHSYSGGAGDSLGAGGPFEFLLKFEENALCLFCHDGVSTIPDVRGVNAHTTPVRQAGALPTGTNPYEQWKGHSLYSTATAPGGAWSDSVGLACIDCHHQHGYAGYGASGPNNAYRNLRVDPGGVADARLITYATGTNDTDVDVYQRATTAANHWNRANIDFNEPDASASAYAAWCRGCHTDFHGSAGDAWMGGVVSGASWQQWKRHPNAQVNIGTFNHGHSADGTFGSRRYRVQVMSPTGDWGPQAMTWASPATDLTPSCMSCHKAHGNKNPFGLVYMRTDTLGTGWSEEGDGGTTPKGLCKQCHVQG
jgi:hypothetical protein